MTDPWETLKPILANPANLAYAFIFPLFFIMNFVILLGPMMLMGITQMQGLMLLRREAVELSLYTFKVLPEIETVVSLFPPVPRGEGQPPQTFAVYFQRRHLERLLGQPISKTLPERPPFAQGDITPGEAETINRLTETRLFSSSFEQLQTQGVILNLAPPSA